jgi:hypothetical protein
LQIDKIKQILNMEEQNVTPENIANAFATAAQAVIDLKHNNILDETVTEKINTIALKFLTKVEECVDCAEFDCCKEPCGCEDEGNETNECNPATIEEWACMLNFTNDLQNNLNLFQGMDINGYQGAIESYYCIIGNNEAYAQLLVEAQASDDYTAYILTHGLGIVNTVTPTLPTPFNCGNNQETTNCKDDYFINIGINWGFGEDLNTNISIINGLTSDELQSLSKDVVYGIYLDAATCQSEYLTEWETLLANAVASGDVDTYWREYLINFANSMQA